MTESPAGGTAPGNEAATAGLSAVEEIMLRFVREGKFDAEIAVRTGMTVGEAKTRMQAICRRLGVANREALAAWEPRDARFSAEEQAAGEAAGRGVPGFDARDEPAETELGAGARGRTHLAFTGGLIVGAATTVVVMLFLLGGAPPETRVRGPEPQPPPGVGAGSQFQPPASAMPAYTSVYPLNAPWYLAIIGPAIGARIAAGDSADDSNPLIPAGY